MSAESTAGFIEPDWTLLLQYPPQDLECRCGRAWTGYAKGVLVGESFTMVSKDPCPACSSRTTIKRASSRPERWEIRR